MESPGCDKEKWLGLVNELAGRGDNFVNGSPIGEKTGRFERRYRDSAGETERARQDFPLCNRTPERVPLRRRIERLRGGRLSVRWRVEVILDSDARARLPPPEQQMQEGTREQRENEKNGPSAIVCGGVVMEVPGANPGATFESEL